MKACGGWIPQELVTLAGPTRRGVDAAMDASEWAAAVTVRAGQVGGPARAAWCRGRAYVPGLLALALAGFARPLFARCDRCRTLSCSTPLDATSLAAPGWPSTWVLRSSCPVSG